MKFYFSIISLVVAATQAAIEWGNFRGFGTYGEAELGEFPFYAFIQSLKYNGEITKCGGAIIHKNWVLTAAECIER